MLRHFRKMTPFSMVDIPIPFPPKSMLNFGPSSLFFFFYSDNIDSVGGGGGGGGFLDVLLGSYSDLHNYE